MTHGDVTVVITCFNYGRYVREAVDSADSHVIVVDDGSTDTYTLEVLEHLPDHAQVIRQDNAGVSVARNRGLFAAETPFVLVLDADDRLAPGALDAMRACFDADPELGWAYGWMHFFEDWDWVWELPDYDPYKLLHRHLVGPTALMRRELVEATGGYDSSFRHYEDWEIWVHAMACGFRGERVPQVTHEYRKHGSSKFRSDRADYRYWYRRMRAKHPQLYARVPELARETGASPLTRLAYEVYFAWRPMPAAVESWLQRIRWGSHP